MSKCQSYRLKKPGRPTRPDSLVCVHVETVDVGRGSADPRSRLRQFRRGHVAAVRYRRGHWTPVTRASFGTAVGLWSWIHSFAQKKGLTYVVPEIASDCFTVCEFWRQLERPGLLEADRDSATAGRVGDGGAGGGTVVRRLVLQGRPDIIQYQRDDKTLCWLSGRQFFDTGTADLRAMLGTDGAGEERGGHAPLPPLRDHCDDELTWLKAMMKFADWFAGLNAGPFPRTVPNASMQFFRSRMGKSAPIRGTDQEVIDLERRASHGGRASCWFVGDVLSSADVSEWPEWVRSDDERPRVHASAVQFDIRSTYPSLLRDNLFPVRLLKFTRRHGPQDLSVMARTHLALSHVRIQTELSEYPHRRENSVIYPVGDFTATLCGPELSRALADGIVKEVYETAYYEPGRPFVSAADELLAMRASARASGDVVWETMVKLLGNSLGGKLSQRSLGWVRCPGRDCPGRWGDNWHRNADTGAVAKYRHIAGLAFERQAIQAGNGTLLACFAFLTSYCRYRMRLIREQLPARSVYAQDTDGLWVNGLAAGVLRNPANALTGELPGELREVTRSRALRLLGPKHYRSDKGWVLAGYHRPVVRESLRVSDTQVHNPVRSGTRSPPAGLEIVSRQSVLSDVDPGGRVGPDGWWHPHRLPVDRDADPGPLPHLPPPPLPL